MSLESWPYSIDLPETSSGGLLLRDSKKLLARWRSSEGLDPGVLGRAVIHTTVNTARGTELSFWAEGDEEELLKRVLGCAMMVIMPREGIDEALMSLKEIFEFRAQTHYRILPLPEKAARGKGKLARASKRPDLVISD